MPNISVIIFVDGSASDLSQCLDSVVNQTLTDIEIILVCGALSEHVSGICSDFKNRYNNIKIIHTDNSNLADAYDMGVTASNGRYIMFIRAEDFIAPNACEIMFNDAVKNDSDLVKCGFVQHSRHENKTLILNWEEWILSTIKPEDIPFQLSKYKILLAYNGAVWMTLFKADFIKTMKFTEGCGSAYQEYAFVIKCLVCAQRISVVSDKLYFWNIDNSDTAVIKGDENLLRIIEPFEAAKQWMISQDCFDEYITEFYKQVMIITKGFYETASDKLKPVFYKRLQQFYSDINMFVFPQVSEMFSAPQVRFLIDILKDN